METLKRVVQDVVNSEDYKWRVKVIADAHEKEVNTMVALIEADRFVGENIQQLCADVLHWHETATIRGETFNKLVALLRPAVGDNALKLAEDVIKEQAVTIVANRSSDSG